MTDEQATEPIVAADPPQLRSFLAALHAAAEFGRCVDSPQDVSQEVKMNKRKKMAITALIVLVVLILYRGLIYKDPSDNKPLFIELGSVGAGTDFWVRLSDELTAHPYVPIITVTWYDQHMSSSSSAKAVYNRKKGTIEEQTSGSGPEGLRTGHYVFTGVTDDMIHAAATDHKGYLEIVEYGCKHQIISQTLTEYPEAKKAR